MSRRFRKERHVRLPTKLDFVPISGNLEQEMAWKNFGGLSFEDAKLRFEENPLYYQEDFMFMGTKAFLFYFPILEQHLRSATADDNDDHQAWIIAHCIKMQLEQEVIESLRPLLPRFKELATFIRGNLSRYEPNEADQQRIAAAWRELEQHIEKIESEQ